jgi:hypothetical protein
VGNPDYRLGGFTSVAICGSLCLVFYERGGFAKTDDVAVFHITPNGAEPVWHAYRGPGVKDPAGLMVAIKADKTLVGDGLFF